MLRRKLVVAVAGIALVVAGFGGGWLVHESTNQPLDLSHLTNAQAFCLNSAGTAPGCTIKSRVAPPDPTKITPWTAK